MKKLIKLEQIELNEGQIEGLKSNPRVIDEKKYKKLVQSIKELPGMLEHRGLLVYPNKKKFVVVGGNMRLRALQELGYAEVWCEVLDIATPIEQLNEMLIKDNLSYGAWDWEQIKEDWEVEQLESWGMDMPNFDDLKEEEDENPYTAKIIAPIYEPKNEKPKISEIIDKTKSEELIRKINNSEIDKATKEFLIEAAKRHTIFNYEKIADFYAHETKEVQELMEDSALIIIDFNKAIQNGFVSITKDMTEMYRLNDK